MSGWFNKKTRLEKLQKKYADLMKKSFQLSAKDAEASEKAKQKAEEIFNKIQYLTLKRADK